jgi:hypothetical protein
MIDKKEDDEKNTDLIDLIDNQTPNTNMHIGSLFTEDI